MNSDKLTYLPKEFKDIFKRTNKRLHEYGEVFTLVKFSFITTMIIFAAESDEEEFEDVKKCRKIISDYLKNEEFLQSKVAKISDNHQYYIESFYKQGIIYLWSSLEIFIKELIEELIKYDNCYLSNNELSKIKIPMTEYFSFSDEDKISYLAALVIEKSKSTYLRGVDKFEGYLSSFNLNGSVDSKHKTNIYNSTNKELYSTQ